jgi:AhpD family alkylhydroperoxidase
MTTPRLSFRTAAPGIYRALEALAASAELEPRLGELVRIRASQLNGCAFCVDTHSVDAQKAGEHDRRIFAVAAWRAAEVLGEQALVRLMGAIIAINAWNRVAVATALQPEGLS